FELLRGRLTRERHAEEVERVKALLRAGVAKEPHFAEFLRVWEGGAPVGERRAAAVRDGGFQSGGAAQSAPGERETAEVVGLTHEGEGIVRSGKTVFVAGALPGETVIFERTRRHRQHDRA